ncbi:MAG TPA: hypothetical protein PLX06_13980 [Fimbriimonadaceae bacterium]|nr:hypothetical protein [Fimbriimonadaceae bacterium]
MTSLNQLSKLAQRALTPLMKERGFSPEKRFVYWRKRGPLYDLIWSEVLTGGALLRIGVTIWSPWVDDPSGALHDFPPSSYLIGGSLSDEFPAVMHGGHLFDVSTPIKVEIAFRQILELLDGKAIPWFDSVRTFDEYMSYVGRRGFHPSPDYREQIRRGLAKGFESEPLPQ